MPSLMIFTPCDLTCDSIATIADSIGWHTIRAACSVSHLSTLLDSGVDAVLFDMPHSSTAMTNCIEEVSSVAPHIPMIFISADALYIQELGLGLRYHVAADQLDDLVHILISLGYGFPGETDADSPVHVQNGSVPRVLIVDANVPLTTSMGRSLRALERFDVRIVASGFEAISVLSSFHPHVAVVDLAVEDMNGRDVCSFIRGREKLCDTKIIGLTAAPSLVSPSSETYLDATIQKPFGMNELIDAVTALLD